jgi:lipoprotein-releasing system permease protein
VPRGFQWFVAWRYLMARPRQVSSAILVVAGAAAAVAVVTAVLGLWVLEQPETVRGMRQVANPARETLLQVAAGAAALFELVVLLGGIRYFFTFFTTVSMGGVAIGTMALIIVLSVMNGFETDLRDKILGSNAHLQVTKPQGKLTEYREVGDRLRGVAGLVAHTPYLVSEVVIGANSNYANVVIKGIDPFTVGRVTDLEDNIEKEGSLDRLWPLHDDGGVRGPGRDAGPEGDAGPDDDAAPAALQPPLPEPTELAALATEIDPPPDDLLVGDEDPIDFSAPGADAGVARPAPLRPPAPAAAAIAEIGEEDDFDDVDAEDFRRGFAESGPRLRTTARSHGLDGVLVGKELSRNLHLYVGQEVSLVSPLGQMTPAGPAPQSKPYRVAGVFFTGMYEYDTKFIYVELHSLQQFLSLDDEANGIEIRIVDPDRTEPVKRQVAERLGSAYEVRDWQELNRNLFSALKLEKIAMFLVLAIIILVASFSIIDNLIMVVVEKAREIALLKTLGSSSGGILKVFVVQGFFIGLVGTVLGVANGLVACVIGKTYGLPLDPDVYYIDRLPIAVELWAVGAVTLAGVLISVVATLYPAYVAARLRPVEGLRYE